MVAGILSISNWATSIRGCDMRYCAMLCVLLCAVPMFGQARKPAAKPAVKKTPASDPCWQGFRGLKWGAKIDEIAGMTQVVPKRDGEEQPPLDDKQEATALPDKSLAFYEREGDKLQIGDIVLDTIEYGFFDGKLCAVRLRAETAGVTECAELLTAIFGTPDVFTKGSLILNAPGMTAHHWQTSKVLVTLYGQQVASPDMPTNILMLYLPLAGRHEQSLTRQRDQAAKDRQTQLKAAKKDL